MKIDADNKYSVFMIKDSFTHKDFIQKILVIIFDKSEEEAVFLLDSEWINNKKYIASYIKEIAVAKKTHAERNAKNYDFPLKIILEKD